jgi:hypothetical protein
MWWCGSVSWSGVCVVCCAEWDNSNFSTTATGSSKAWQYPMLFIQFWAPDDGRRTRLKHVEHFTQINTLFNVASCWLYLKIHLRRMDPWVSKFFIQPADGYICIAEICSCCYMWGKVVCRTWSWFFSWHICVWNTTSLSCLKITK